MTISKLFITPTKNGLFLANTATAQDFQGRGIFSSFMRSQQEVATQRGKQHLEFDVSVENPKVQRLHEHLGAKVIAERHLAGHANIAGVRRMVWKER